MMTNRSIAVLLIALATTLPAGGCATTRTANGAAASITYDGSRLAGTWYGTGGETNSSSTGRPYLANYVLRIEDDGTATLSGRLLSGPAFAYSGTATMRGNLVILSETNGSHWLSLKWWDNSTLYAVTDMARWRAGVRGPVAIEFHRAADGS